MNWRRDSASTWAARKRVLLLLQIAGHAVEGAREHGDLLGIVAGVDPGGEVAAGHPARGLHQPGDGAAMLLAAAMPSQTAPTSTSSTVSR